jgi:hypothetical protein
MLPACKINDFSTINQQFPLFIHQKLCFCYIFCLHKAELCPERARIAIAYGGYKLFDMKTQKFLKEHHICASR